MISHLELGTGPISTSSNLLESRIRPVPLGTTDFGWSSPISSGSRFFCMLLIGEGGRQTAVERGGTGGPTSEWLVLVDMASHLHVMSARATLDLSICFTFTCPFEKGNPKKGVSESPHALRERERVNIVPCKNKCLVSFPFYSSKRSFVKITEIFERSFTTGVRPVAA